MRTSAFIVVLAAAFVAGCGDSNNGSVARPDLCSNGAAAEGDSCGTGMICRASQCVPSKCGDGIVAAGEECDDGNAIDGDGCNSDCKFTCLSSDDTRNCAPADACAGKGVCSDAHVCITGKPLADGQSCGVGGPNVCQAGVCTSPLCGNGKLDFGEECDDGGKLNLDGCDSACKVEQASRVIALEQQVFADPPFCEHNAIGSAITDTALSTIQLTWDQPISDGSLSIVFKFLGHIDPFGTSSTFKLGFVNALPIRFDQQGTSDGYSGVSDLDWWYAADPASVDNTQTPISQLQLDGQITDRHLTAGPGTLTGLNIKFALVPTTVTLFHTKVDAFIDVGVSHPIISTSGAAPGHLASEHVAPGLFEFVSSSSGSICADVSVASLANTPIGDTLQMACFTNPDGTGQEFTPDNHLLDAFVTGCHILGIEGILPTQPDGSLDGAKYAFQFDPATRAVTGCTKIPQGATDPVPAELPDCFAQATYSSLFKLKADRVIIKRAQ
jgi:cysteine-rich repeat protein